MKMEAEAEGKKKLAEAKAKDIEAETAHLRALTDAKTPSDVMISWILKDKYEGIVGADVEKFKHIQTGNVTVIGGAGETGNFMLKTAEAISKFKGLKDYIPGMSGILGKLENFDSSNRQTLPTKEETKE